MDFEGPNDDLARVNIDVRTPRAAVDDATAEQQRELDASIAACLRALDEEPPWEPLNDVPQDELPHRSR